MTKSLTKAASDDLLNQLSESYVQEENTQGILLPRLGFYSQDKTEETGKGKDKKIKVIAAAGEFFIEKQTDELDENGKKIWEKTEIGDSFEGIILYKRHQLKMYDESTEEYTSSPIYDSKDEVLPLFCNKKEIARGTPAELKEQYLFTDRTGKTKSALEENRILYVLYKDEVYQLNLRGSSMYSLMAYERVINPTTVVTEFSSEAMEKGEISWNKMTFKAVRKLTEKEAHQVLEIQRDTNEAVAASKANFKKDSGFDQIN